MDYAFVNSNFINEVVDCVYLKNVFGSDHCPLLLTLKNKPQLGKFIHKSTLNTSYISSWNVEFTTLCPELSSDHLRKVTSFVVEKTKITLTY